MESFLEFRKKRNKKNVFLDSGLGFTKEETKPRKDFITFRKERTKTTTPISTFPEIKESLQKPKIKPKKSKPFEFRIGEGLKRDVAVKSGPTKQKLQAIRRGENIREIVTPVGVFDTEGERKKEREFPYISEYGKARAVLGTESFYMEQWKKRQREIMKSAEELPKGYKEPGIIGQVIDSVKLSTLNNLSALGSSLEDLGYKINSRELVNRGAEISDKFKEIIVQNPEWQEPQSDKFKGTPDYYARLVTGAVPSIGGTIMVSAIGGVAGGLPGAGIAGFTFAKQLEGGAAYQEARNYGASPQQAGEIATSVGNINGILEFLPVGRILKKTKSGKLLLDKILKRTTKEMAKQGVTEAGTEAGQEIVLNAFIKEVDLNRGLFDNTMESLIAGGGAGVLFGGGSTIVTSPELKQQLKNAIESQGGFTKTPGEEQYLEREEAKIDREQERIRREAMEFIGEKESQYQDFKKLVTPKQVVEIEDAEQFKKKVKAKVNVIDNILYSQEMTADEVFQEFKNRRLDETTPLPEVPKETKAIVAEKTRQKSLETIETLKQKYKTEKKWTKESIVEAQRELRRIVKESDISAKDRDKFDGRIRGLAKYADPLRKLDKILDDVKVKINELKTTELKGGIEKQINKELKFTKPVKKGDKRVSKFDYETNKVLEGMRNDNKLTQEQAELKLNNIPTENLTETEKIKARFLSLKVNGKKSSPYLYEQVLADIKNLKEIGETAKEEADVAKKLEKQEKQEEVLGELRKQKPSRKVLASLKKLYLSSVANLYSTLNATVGKKIADKYDYGRLQTKTQANFNEKIEIVVNDVINNYGLKNKNQLNKKFIKELAPVDYKIIDNNGIETELSKFQLMDIYNAIKNEHIKERYYNNFGKEQVDGLLQNLTVEDAQFADLLMENVQEYRDILNQRSIEITGRDLGSIENYWPSTSKYKVDFYDDIKTQGETPSAMKQRQKSSKILPKPVNAWLKFQKHTAQAEHIKTLSPIYEELKNVFDSDFIETEFKKKYGDEAYFSLQNNIETFSLNYKTERLDVFDGVMNTALNNWVKAKIGSPTVFVRQLISTIYSVEKVGIKNYTKYNKDFVTNPRKVFNYMWKNVPSIKARYKRGYSEALQDAIKGANQLKVGMGSLTKYLTILTRTGDITAVMVNGYPIIKTEIAKHGDMNKAIKEMEKFSEKTQQSGAPANLSSAQRNKGFFHRLFFRFKNTTNQLLRLQTDATVQFINKQITPKEFASKTIMYSMYTPIMYTLSGYAVKEVWKGLWGEDEDEEGLLGDILQNILIQPFQALPLMDAMVEQAYAEVRKRITGKDYYYGEGIFSYPLLDDVSTAWSKLKKKEPDGEDFLRVMSLLQEPTIGIPTETILRYYRYTQPRGGGKKSKFDKVFNKPSNKFDKVFK